MLKRMLAELVKVDSERQYNDFHCVLHAIETCIRDKDTDNKARLDMLYTILDDMIDGISIRSEKLWSDVTFDSAYTLFKMAQKKVK